MPRRPTLSRRLATAARWPVGVALTSGHYFWRTTPLHRTEELGSEAADAAPPLEPGVSGEEIQGTEDGYGPLFHRRYRTRIRGCEHTPESLIEFITTDLDRVAPIEFASFQQVTGSGDEMRVGDEYVVRMPGPWDGPVRVVARSPTSFRFATLDTHLEAGQIEFRAYDEGDLVVFEVESWARSGDRFANLLYDPLRMAKETQLHMWISLLERTARRSGGRMTGGIDIHTRRVST